MNKFVSKKFAGKVLFSLLVSAALFLSQVLIQMQDAFAAPAVYPATVLESGSEDFTTTFDTLRSQPKVVDAAQAVPFADTVFVDLPQQAPLYPFANPAGCAMSQPASYTPEQMLANVQNAIGAEYDLAERRQLYVWNGEQNTMLNVMDDPFVYEFTFDEFQPPLTYRGDKIATIFLTQGFVVWFREYNDSFRLLAIPMVDGVLGSAWASYVNAYWQMNGIPNDEMIYPVMKKLPCHWVIDSGFVSNETVAGMFNLNWNIPDYLSAGRQYLAANCADAYRISQEKIGYWDASSMCGPLAWTILRDANSFPYRIGSWTNNASPFTGANPKWNGQPWGTFDPETFSLFHTDEPMQGYDFQTKGELYTGDIIYSYSTLYVTPGYFDHIFVVAGIDENSTRLTVSNIVRSIPKSDCMIEELALYTPGNFETGAINYEWNGTGSGRTGTNGFDIFRWNWITYHNNGQAMQYTVRWGDTFETIAFDWKVSPESLMEANQFAGDTQLTPGQVIILPALTSISY